MPRLNNIHLCLKIVNGLIANLYGPIPCRQVWQLLKITPTMYTFPTGERNTFRFFLQSRNAHSLTTFLNSHSTHWRTPLIAVLNACSCGVRCCQRCGIFTIAYKLPAKCGGKSLSGQSGYVVYWQVWKNRTNTGIPRGLAGWVESIEKFHFHVGKCDSLLRVPLPYTAYPQEKEKVSDFFQSQGMPKV